MQLGIVRQQQAARLIELVAAPHVLTDRTNQDRLHDLQQANRVLSIKITQGNHVPLVNVVEDSTAQVQDPLALPRIQQPVEVGTPVQPGSRYPFRIAAIGQGKLPVDGT